MKRAKNAAKEAAAGKVSTAETRKAHEQAKNSVQCNICLTGFSKTVKAAELQQHLDNKHPKAGKTIADAFPGFSDSDDE